jgi:hypothetical protein
VICVNGHRFGRNSTGLIDFSAVVASPSPAPDAISAAQPAENSVLTGGAAPLEHGPAPAPIAQPRKSRYMRRLRRGVLLGFSLGYAAILLALLPAGMIVGLWRQPFRQ